MSLSSHVLVYEFFTGGGCPEGPLPAGLASEALGMLWALLADFRSAGIRTITALDDRFSELAGPQALPSGSICRALPGSCRSVFRALLRQCDAAIIIAPETGGILEALTAEAEAAGIAVLGSSSSSVKTAGDKAECAGLFYSAGLPAPETDAVGIPAAFEAAERIGYPLIVKPIDGAGSEDVHFVAERSLLQPALDSVCRATSRDRILLQRFAVGVPASVSLLVAEGKCLPLCLNRQLMKFGARLEYRGSEVPFDHDSKQEAYRVACAAAGRIPGLRGYVGVDMILGTDTVQLIEINPRITTSYIGLRQLTSANLAEAIMLACVKGLLPEKISVSGRVTVCKDDRTTWNLA